MKERLSKIMSQRGLCSRREADALILQKAIQVDGVLITELGTKVHPDCQIQILKKGQEELSNKVTVMLNKPRNFVSSQPEKNYRSALELIKKENFWNPKEGLKYKNFKQKGLAPLGRLDIDSTGLLLYSQNGALAKKIIGECSPIEKEYEVTVQGVLTKDKVEKLKFGLELDGQPLKPAQVFVKSKNHFNLVLTQGKKRQIRRMCELVGLKVTRLHRIRIGHLKIKNLPEGRWKPINPKWIFDKNLKWSS